MPSAASAPAGAPEAAEVVTAPGTTTPEAPAAEEPAEETEEAVEAAEAPAAVEEPSAAPRRTRRRATRPAAAPSAEDLARAEAQRAQEAAAEAEKKAEAEAGKKVRAESKAKAERPAEPVAEDEAEGRRPRRRAVRRPAGGFTSPRAAEGEAQRRPGRPAVPVFQAPVFTEPMFQTPERAAYEAAQEAARATEPEAPAAVEEDEEQTVSRRHGRRRRVAEEGAPAVTGQARAEEPEAAAADESADEAEQTDQGDQGDFEETGSRRRRRRGGRRRRRGESGEDGNGERDTEFADEADADETAAEQAEQDAEDTAEQIAEDVSDAEEAEDTDEDGREQSGGSSSSRRRRRRRRRAGDTAAEAEPSQDDPERTVVKVREPRKKDERSGPGDTAADEVQSIKGSTRLEAKKQRRREGREQGRRRVPIITEAEFLARREAVERVMVVRQHGDRTQIGVLEDNILVEHYVNKEQSTSYVGNVYLGKVQNVLPSMEAAFIDIGKGRNAVLYAGEVNFEALGMAHGPRRIETALKSGQSVLVQVTKDPIGHKGARLTSQVSLPGRYLVYVPEGSMTGISRKLPDTERARLKTILKKIVPEDAGVIVRTAAEGASEDELRRDVERLQAQWEEIQQKAKKGNAPTLLYGEPDMTVRVVRDIFNEDFTKVVVSGDEAWRTIHGYVAGVAPDLADRLQRWTSEVDVFATYRIDEQLAKALDRKVWLPSGGSLVIDRTEAMVVIDVNTGKFTGQGGNLEETVTRNNLEAAEEIVRQLRLRDLGGIIVIDFIDMVLESNRDLVLRRLLECLGRDRTKHQVAEVTSLGLVQMTRKRVGQGLLESFSETCVHCNGRGLVVHLDQPTAVGGGGKKKKRGGARDGQQEQPHEHEPSALVAEAPSAEEEAELERAASAVTESAEEPVALPSPDFAADEELYSSVAEAEAAAGRRGRRRTSRRATSPAGAPRGEETEAPEVREPRETKAQARSRRRAEQAAADARAEAAQQAEPTAQEVTAAEEVARPVVAESAAEAQAEPVAVEDPVVPAETAEPAAETAEAAEEAPTYGGPGAPAGRPAVAEPPRIPQQGGPGQAPRRDAGPGYDTEQFAFVEEQDGESEDVIDWLQFTENRTERREEAKRRARARMTAVLVVLALVVVSGGGYLWYAGKLPFLSSSDAAQGSGSASGAQKRDVIVVHLHPTKGSDTSTLLLVDNATTEEGSAVLLPNSLALTDQDGNATTLGQSVGDDGSSGTRESLDTVLGTRIEGTWRLDTPFLQNLVDIVGHIEIDTDTDVPDPKAEDEGAAPLVHKGEQQTLSGKMAAAYATHRGPSEPQSAQLERFGQVMRGVLRKLSSDEQGATVTVQQLGQIIEPPLSDKDLGRFLAGLADRAKGGDYRTTVLPVEADGTLGEKASQNVVEKILGGQAKSPGEDGDGVRVSLRNATGGSTNAKDQPLADLARVALVNGGYTYVAAGSAEAAATSEVRYADAGAKDEAIEVARTLGLPESSVTKGATASNADVTVVLGQDYEPAS
ncbi:Rne/Rng family ribonuclease [Streptomyces chilikensis]|uniref:Rne/Rng family ribonuclease n=1 Tax=Streptomyces chilikensis TaxID=1194079 RepID=UPI003B8491F8